ncbi:MAG: site-2 protease family protein, partial [Propionibacteriaceae bacterium]|nr:site-2 protease family protein [Propionibacteriaceae bacterium]
DRVVEFNGVPISSYDQLGRLIRANLDAEARITVERDGATVPLTPVHTVVTAVADTLDPSRSIQAGWLGVGPKTELVKGGPADVLADMWLQTKQSVVALVQFPMKVWHVVVNMVTGQPRDLFDPISIVGASTVAGQVVASSEVTTGEKVATFASLLASVNLFLALFNFVPLPPLDGGHIAGALYEWLRRRAAQLFRRPDPGFFDTARLLPIAYGVGGLLLLTGAIEQTYGSGRYDRLSGLMRRDRLVAVGFALGLFSLVGLPPTSGLWGKVGLMQAAAGADAGVAAALIGAVIVASIASLMALIRLWREVFWGPPMETYAPDDPEFGRAPRTHLPDGVRVPVGLAAPGLALIGVSVLMFAFAGVLYPVAAAAGDALADVTPYVAAVLG